MLKKYKPQDWNEIAVVVKEGVAHCTCNGEVLEAALKLPPQAELVWKPTAGKWNTARIVSRKASNRATLMRLCGSRVQGGFACRRPASGATTLPARRSSARSRQGSLNSAPT